MTAVRLRESASYGARLYAYLLGVTLLGGACLAIGLVLAAPELTSLLAGGAPEPAMAAGGAILAVLGLSILLTGYLGAGYKLVADAVAVGEQTAASPTPSAETATETATESQAGAPADRQPAAGSASAAGGDASLQTDDAERVAAGNPETGPQRAPSVDPHGGTDPAAESTDAHADPTVDEAAEPASDGPDEAPPRENPPEPSPEEIAFGSSGGDETAGSAASDVDVSEDADQTDSLEDEDLEETTSSSRSVSPAGRNAPSDPLADRSDGE
jgi:hypothetical protein